MAKILVFDLDGTLLDSLADIRHALNTALAENGLPGHASDSVRSMVGHGLSELVKKAVPPEVLPDAGRVLAVLEAMRTIYREIPFRHTLPYPGIPELLQDLRADGHTLAVLTNKANAIAGVIIQHFFPGVFSLVQGEIPDQPRKPHPDALLNLLGRLESISGMSGIDQAAIRKRSVLIGDSEADIHTARDAGVRAIGVSWGFRSPAELLAAGAAEVVDSAAALKQALAQTLEMR